jgi:hypothetical protein
MLIKCKLVNHFGAAKQNPYNVTRRQWIVSALGLFATTIASPFLAQSKIRRIRTQYIATLASSGAKSGTGAET